MFDEAVDFLGYCIDKDGLQKDPDKAMAFFGGRATDGHQKGSVFRRTRQLLPQFGTPSTSVDIFWNNKRQQAFETKQKLFTGLTVLAHYAFHSGVDHKPLIGLFSTKGVTETSARRLQVGPYNTPAFFLFHFPFADTKDEAGYDDDFAVDNPPCF